MKRILSSDHVEVLAQFAWSRLLLAFDYDGTLAPIVEDRDRAFMRPRTRELFAELAARYPCVVISGRSRDDVTQRLEGIAVLQVVGNHGLEPTATMDSFEKDAEAVRPALERALAGIRGVDVEDKRYSLAVHYRRSRSKQEAREAILRVVPGLERKMRVVLGKLVVNVIPEKAPNKGDALIALRDREGMDTAMYLGDDVTDEDVFELDHPGRLLSIRVGRSRSSAAPYYVRDQEEVDVLLKKLVDLRANGAPP